MTNVDARGTYTEERAIFGPTVSTPELHNVGAHSTNGCVPVGDGRWCYKPSELIVQAPGDKWVFFGAPRIDVVQDNHGSVAWNRLDRNPPPADIFSVTLNNPDEIRARVLTGSRSVRIRLACMARYYPG